jgi:integrase
MLTDKQVRALRTDLPQQDFMDGAGLPGFGVRVTRAGRKCFTLLYRLPWRVDPRRTQRRVTLGQYPFLSLAEARKRALEILGVVASGQDPDTVAGRRYAIRRPRQEGTRRVTPEGPLAKFFPEGYLQGSFGELAAVFLERVVWVRDKRPRNREYLLRRDLLPAWSERPLTSITRQDVTGLLDKIVLRGAPATALTVRTLMQVMFNFAIERQLCEVNPVAGTRPPAKENSRDRFLTVEEIAILWPELERRSHRAYTVLKAVLATGQRPGEVCNMEWSEIDGEWWEIPAEKVKNGRAHRVYLGPTMATLLEELRLQTGGQRFVFLGERRGRAVPVTTLTKHMASLRKSLPFDFNPHDLRRTVVTHLAKLEVPYEVREAVVNHKQGGVAGVYNRYDFAREKKAALLLWDQHLQEILNAASSASGQPAKPADPVL